MNKKAKGKFSDYTVTSITLRLPDEAMDELRREIDVRRKIYDRWVLEGRLSWTDAHDRLERLLTALKLLIDAPEQPNLADVESQVDADILPLDSGEAAA